MKKILVNLATLTITAVVMLLLLELILVFVPVPDPFENEKILSRYIPRYIPSAHTRNYTFQISTEEGLTGVDSTAVFTTNSYGFRGDEMAVPKPEDEFRIFMVGGSTTECLILDDSKDLCRIVQQNLNDMTPRDMNIAVYNAGKSGDRIYDHMAMISQRIVQFEPDMIIVFAGINDLAAGIGGFDYLHYPPQSGGKASFIRQIVWLSTEFQLPRRLYSLYNVISPRGGVTLFQSIASKTNYREKVEFRRSQPLSDEIPRVNLAPYAAHLRSLAGIAEAHDFQLVYMTQASTWNSEEPEAEEWHWMTYVGNRQLREDLMDSALEQYNDVMREIGEEQNVPVYDLAESAPKSLTYFYDDCHFTNVGAETFGFELAEFLIDENLISRESEQ